MKIKSIKSAKKLEKCLNRFYKGVQFYTDGDDTIFTVRGKEIAKWDGNKEEVVSLHDSFDINEIA